MRRVDEQISVSKDGSRVLIAKADNAVSFRPETIGRVLIVDDEPEILEILEEVLNSANIETKTATEPGNVSALIESFRPDALFTDVSMPGLSGLQLLQLVGDSHPDLPVVFISGFVNKDLLLKAVNQGVFGVIEKPFDLDQVAECGINAIKKHKMNSARDNSVNIIKHEFSFLKDFLNSSGHKNAVQIIFNELSFLAKQPEKSSRSKSDKAA